MTKTNLLYKAKSKDLMIIVLATAIGFSWSYAGQTAHKNWKRTVYPMLLLLDRSKSKFERCWVSAKSYCPCLACWMIAFAALTLQRPSPQLRRSILRPGIAACYASVLVIGFEVVRACSSTFTQIVRHNWAIQAFGHHHRFVWWETLIPSIVPSEIALGIGSAWLILLLSRRFRYQPDWIDLQGRILGCLWFSLAFIDEMKPWELFETDFSLRSTFP
jgi:hypothetical protein